MEAVADFALSTVPKTLFGSIKRHIGYAFGFRGKFNALNDETRKLKLERESLHDSIEDARRRGEVVKPRFIDWQTEAETAITAAEALVRNGEETAQKSCSLFLNLKTRYRVGKKADEGMPGVVQLLAEKDRLGTNISYLPDLQQIVKPPVEGYEAQSRTIILSDVMDALSDPNITMVGLYGMGGIGKTTLAEEVYRQATRKSLFYKVVIAKITAMPKIRDIQDKIAEFIIGSKLEESTDDARASGLNQRLNEILKTKKILIILDDLWSRLDLDEVGIPTDSKRCKILMTSRRLDLLRDMGSKHNFPLQTLSEEESMSLFEKKVIMVKDHRIAKKMLDRCAGFPLLIVTIAGLLNNKRKDLDAWEDVLTQLYKFDNQEIADKVYCVLELSYDRLPSEKTKLIFLLSGICSCPYLELKDLLRYCFDLGLFKNYTISQARRHLKTLIGDLKACDLLDIDEDDYVSMHDVVQDVAIWIACRKGLSFRNRDDNELTEWPSRGDINNCTKISMISINIENLPENLGCPDVEFLLLSNKRGSINIPNSSFEGTKQLKVVHFSELEFTFMPRSLYSLENLHTLCLEGYKLPNLDSAIGQLENLEILSLHGSNLEALPCEVGQLSRLKLLDLSYCYNLDLIPANVISKLTSLEELLMKRSFQDWEIEGHTGGINASLSELKYLSKLASLQVCVPDIQALPGSFFSMCLERYEIMIGRVNWALKLHSGIAKALMMDLSTKADLFEKARNLLMEADVVSLHGINGMTNLSDNQGFPKWKELSIVQSSTLQQVFDCGTTLCFPVLESLKLLDLECLVTICQGRLASPQSFGELKILFISGCHKMKSLFSISAVQRLPQLEEIKINSCDKMESLFFIDEGSTQVVEFPCLRLLELIGLPQLKCFLDVRTSKSSKTASTTTNLVPLFNEMVSLPSLEILELHSINIEMIWSSGASRVSGQLNSLTERSPHKLESLYISRCHSLKFLFPPVIAKTFSELKNLEVEECEKLEEIVAGEESTNSLPFHFSLQLTSLTLLKLQELRSLYPFGHTSKWPNLGKLEIHGCPKIIGFWLFGEQGSSTGVGQSHITSQEKAFPNLEELSVDGQFSKSNLNSPSRWSHVPELKTLELKSFRGRWIFEHSETGVFGSLSNLRQLDVLNSHIKQLWEYKRRSRELDAPLSGLRILTLFDVKGLRYVGRRDSNTEDPLLPFLESLALKWCPDLISLALSPSASFRNLTTLEITSCNEMTGLLNPSTAKTMVNLVNFWIWHCSAMEEVVSAKEVEEDQSCINIIVFNKLKTLTLAYLDNLNGFCTSSCYSFKFPCLEYVYVLKCGSMRIFCDGDAITPKLQKIKTGNFGDKQYWEVDINTTIKQICEERLQYLVEKDKKLRLSSLPHLVGRWGTENIFPFNPLDELVVDKCAPLLPIAVPLGVLPSLVKLKKLVVENCESVEEIFDLEGTDQDNEDVMSELQKLEVTQLPKLRHVWNEGPLGILGSFQNLSVLKVDNCNNLTHIFTLSVALGLVCLTRLEVTGCGLVEVIINQQGEHEKPTPDIDDHSIAIVFPSMNYVELKDLPGLKEFCSGGVHSLRCPALNKITLVGCPGMRLLGGSTNALDIPPHDDDDEETVNKPSLRIFNDQVVIFGLQELNFQWNSNMDTAWHELVPRKFLHSLKHVKLAGFPADHELLPLDFVQVMPNLEKFLIFDSFYKQTLPNGPRFVHDAGSLDKLRYLELFNLPELSNLIEEEDFKLDSVFHHLKELKVSKCKALTRLMTSATAWGLDNLEKIIVEDCEEMTDIVSSDRDEEDLLSGSLFQHLKRLEVSKCKGLVRLLTSSTARGLRNLEKLVVKECGRITEIVWSNGGGEVGDEIAFDQLNYMELQDLPCLTSFSSGDDTFSFPLLEDMVIIECPNMKTFSKSDPITPILIAVQIAEIDDEDPWHWEGELNNTIEKLYAEMNPSSST